MKNAQVQQQKKCQRKMKRKTTLGFVPKNAIYISSFY